MVELHAWATIRESYEVDNEEDNIHNIVKEIQQYIKDFNWISDLCVLEFYNGSPSLSVVLFKNRFTQEVKEVFSLFEYIAKIAKGSYGLIYLYDDENTEGKENIFQVYSLARGKIAENKDTFLSPIIPKIEDAE